ncbi:uncharacterized protein LOC108138129 isoform X7 [Drosophila elegans]|uniref:uncharacterized protein LOC108138129 isoform X7 n=1 Tax=Drosophila elegans TaxID=30023 RepID=UPI001BC85B95|nr:uncharacterized protein LOC108138129 isoform X7 [Drosophila elegans]
MKNPNIMECSSSLNNNNNNSSNGGNINGNGSGNGSVSEQRLLSAKAHAASPPPVCVNNSNNLIVRYNKMSPGSSSVDSSPPHHQQHSPPPMHHSSHPNHPLHASAMSTNMATNGHQLYPAITATYWLPPPNPAPYLVPVPPPKSDHGGLFGSAGREIRGHAKGKRPKEDAADSRLLRHQHAERCVCRLSHTHHKCGHGADSRPALGGTLQSIDDGRSGGSAAGPASWRRSSCPNDPRSDELLDRSQCVLDAQSAGQQRPPGGGSSGGGGRLFGGGSNHGGPPAALPATSRIRTESGALSARTKFPPPTGKQCPPQPARSHRRISSISIGCSSRRCRSSISPTWQRRRTTTHTTHKRWQRRRQRRQRRDPCHRACCWRWTARRSIHVYAESGNPASHALRPPPADPRQRHRPSPQQQQPQQQQPEQPSPPTTGLRRTTPHGDRLQHGSANGAHGHAHSAGGRRPNADLKCAVASQCSRPLCILTKWTDKWHTLRSRIPTSDCQRPSSCSCGRGWQTDRGSRWQQFIHLPLTSGVH